MAFILTFQAPVELEDLADRYERDRMTNIDHILNFDETPGEWTVDKRCSVGDTVFFRCAATSYGHIRRLANAAKREGKDELARFAEEERERYKEYAGMIVAVGKVADAPFQSEGSGYDHHYWRSPWYAKIGDFKLLSAPLYIDPRGLIKISSIGSITKLDAEQERWLWELIRQEAP